MRIENSHKKRVLRAMGAALLLTASATSAQTPIDVEDAVDQSKAALQRAADDVMRFDADGNVIDTTEASFGAPVLPQDNAAGIPSEGYFFESDGPRAFLGSPNGRRIVHPLSAPNYNDDAYITSDLRVQYINHQFPRNSTTNGGAARLFGLQFRKALNERLQFQVSKLGITDVHLGGSENAGLSDIAVAIKYAFLQDWESQTHASVGVGYELGVGDKDALGSDDELRVFAAINKGFDRSHIGLSVNTLFATGPEDGNGDSDRLAAFLHYDYEVNEMFSPIVELNYYKTLNNGSPVTSFSGLDLGNFGGNKNEDALSMALGGEVRVQRDLAVRIGYERALTDNVDLWGYRWTASAIWRF